MRHIYLQKKDKKYLGKVKCKLLTWEKNKRPSGFSDSWEQAETFWNKFWSTDSESWTVP